jgi:colanic acid biosynthesis protein WcaH
MLTPEEFASVVRLTPLVSIDLIVYERRRGPHDRVLVGRRLYEPAKGFLFVPGGRIRKNETLNEAFERLTLNELGTQFRRVDSHLFGVYEHIYPTNTFGAPGFGTHYVVLAHSLRMVTELPALPMNDQHTEYKWMSAADILASDEVHANTKAYFR